MQLYSSHHNKVLRKAPAFKQSLKMPPRFRWPCEWKWIGMGGKM